MSQAVNPADKILAWTYSLSFPLAVVALITLRAVWGYEWPLPGWFGFVLLATGLASLLRDAIFLKFPAVSPASTRQALYSDVWVVLVGGWMYWKPLGDVGLALLISIAFGLWPLSHLELQRRVGILRNIERHRGGG
ncbi:MAG TPA: hypothetical protein VEC38_12100 [Candidatus Binataceae bacterium]|nr:hypothetical protein [Candidatus Binataceae bacterium]